MDRFLELLAYYNNIVNGIVWGAPMLCLLFGVGVFYTIITKGFQVTHVKDVYEHTIKGLFKKKNQEER